MGTGLVFFIISHLVRFDFLIMCMYYFNKSENLKKMRKAQRKKKKKKRCKSYFSLIPLCNMPWDVSTASRQADFTWK